MPVDIFGLMKNGSSESNKYPTLTPSFNLNLKDLKDVEGFDENGKTDVLYGFKLSSDNGIYKREEIHSDLPNKITTLQNEHKEMKVQIKGILIETKKLIVEKGTLQSDLHEIKIEFDGMKEQMKSIFKEINRLSGIIG